MASANNPSNTVTTARRLPVLSNDGAPTVDEAPHTAPHVLGRRRFMELMGASVALSTGAGCTIQPTEKIIPYVKQPEDLVPGRPRFYATAAIHAGVATAVLAESHMGRPTKLEGNPDHPSSVGALDIFSQASVLSLYDPDRSKTVLKTGLPSTYGDVLGALGKAMTDHRAARGRGLAILTGEITSPTARRQLDALVAELPRAKWYVYEAAGRDQVRRGSVLAFGSESHVRYELAQASRIVCLDADLFNPAEPGSVRYARDFATGKRAGVHDPSHMTRLYAFEPTPSVTGASADHRFAVSHAGVAAVAAAIAKKLGVAAPTLALPHGVTAAHIDAVAADLDSHRGHSVVAVGPAQSPEVHALAHAINGALGNLGKTVALTAPIYGGGDNYAASITELSQAITAGKVQTLLILDVNAVYSAPAELDFAAKLMAVPLRVHWGSYVDETAFLCSYHVPASHSLEAWGDARAWDTSAIVQQPLIAPLYKSKSLLEMLAALSFKPTQGGQELVRETWKHLSDADWQIALHDGWVKDSALPPSQPSLQAPQLSLNAAEGTEVIFRADETIFDGRYANNGWLQELSRPMTKLTWDNTIMVSRKTANALGITLGRLTPDDVMEYDLDEAELVELSVGDRKVVGPLLVMPGQADDTITVHLGYGRERAGVVGDGAGFSATPIRTAAGFWAAGGAQLRRTGGTMRLAVTQGHHNMEGRNFARSVKVGDYKKDHEIFHAGAHHASERSLYPAMPLDEKVGWGMAIDLNACIGCSACTIACQAENNIPVVGKEEVLRSREMAWIRVDRYFEGDKDQPEVRFQPVTCMQCENAACEVVCPANATSHHPEGLNDMAYNRCIGTKYCQNNCAYKVRRFNFFPYAMTDNTTSWLQHNPDVTVRSRGVMEKCTYCVQRINYGRTEAKKAGKEIADGAIQTACEVACPTQAITFGNIRDKSSKVSQAKAEHRNYTLLDELNNAPRTSYLGHLRNPNPELA